MMKHRILVAVLGAGGVGSLLLLVSPGAPGAGAANGCPAALPGPELVFLPAGSASFCMDAREVNQREFAQFLEAVKKDGPPEQPPECEWNDRFEPVAVPVSWCTGPIRPGSCLAGTFDPETRGDYAMSCVDWCDARAYCAWAGKRLCGGLGAAEETLETRGDPTVSEWQYACTNGGVSSYPYGDKYIAGKCDDSSSADLLGSLGSAECRGWKPPFDAVRDLTGSVKEWTAACDGDRCSSQGIAFGADARPCSEGGRTFMRNTLPTRGFRCCADAIEVGR